ncbi:sensor histidine kinase [Melittangium boletus]|uniref:sensor histidine kinase n=1 Tax=Melittangium boletus TaxID=83453 RepID=UPI003DA4710A
MRLRVRLALTTVAVAIPVALCMGWIHLALQTQAVERALSDYALAHMSAEGRARCEASPATWSPEPPPPRPFWASSRHGDLGPPGPPPEGGFGRGPGRGPPPEDGFGRGPPPDEDGLGRGPPRRKKPRSTRLYAYGADLVSLNPRAPALAPALAQALREGDNMASRASGLGPESPRDVLVRMPWTGPCAFVLVQWQGRPESRDEGVSPIPLEFLFMPTGLALVGVLFALGPVVRRLRQLTDEVKVFVRGAYQGRITVRGEDEISELARAFDEAGREVHAQMGLKEERERALRTFLENTTHDVMIPLTVLQGHLAELQRHAAHGEPVEAAVVAAASQEAHYMAALIHNLGAAARLEAGEPGVQRVDVDLNALVARCVSRHRPIARPQGVQLEHAVPEPPVHVRGDDTLLEQAVSNVIYNAVRYNARDGHVAVVLEHLPGGAFRLRVLDDGPGIPEHELPHIMERHVRGDAARTRGPGGHGLGLNIAARVTALHGWTLQLGRSEYGGLQVDFLGEALPAAPPRPPPEGA